MSRQWSQISHRELKLSISHDVVIFATPEPDAALLMVNQTNLVNMTNLLIGQKNYVGTPRNDKKLHK